MKSLYSKYLILVLLLVTVMGFVSCGKEEKEPAKSMEEIRKEEGVPVTVQEIRPGSFDEELTFFGEFHGIKEAGEAAMLSDKIVKINAKVGDYVKEGKIIFEFPTDNPTLQYSQAKDGLELAKKTYDRMSALKDAGEISQQNYDNAKTQYDIAKRNFESIKQILFVDSPMDGKIIHLELKEGEVVKPGTLLFTVAQLKTMKAKVWVSEKEINQIKTGMTAETEWNGEIFKGRVTEVPMMMDSKKKAFGVDIEFPNPQEKLKSGTTSDIKIAIYNKEDAVFVERNLINTEQEKSYVFVYSGGKAEKRYITLGNDYDINVEITSGLTAGEKIINCCMNLIEDGTKVRIVE